MLAYKLLCAKLYLTLVFSTHTYTVMKEECSPGPAYSVNCRLTRYGMDGTPIYSMLGRNKDGSKTKIYLGWCNFIVLSQVTSRPLLQVGTKQRKFIHKEKNMLPDTLLGLELSMPRVSVNKLDWFGHVLRSLCTEDSNPAASSYTLPHMLGYGMPTKLSYPAYTMTGRDHHTSTYHNPGPGRYNAVPLSTYIRKGPAYSMLGRNYFKGSTYNHW